MTPVFDPTAALPGGWRVVDYQPGRRLLLTRAGALQLRELGRQTFVTLAAVAMGVAAWAGTEQAQGFRVVLYPVFLLLGVVVVFGLLSMLRAARRAALGLRLEVDVTASVLNGSVRAGAATSAAFGEIKAVRLTVRRQAGPDPKRPRAWAQLDIELHDGRMLEAPEAWGADTEWESARALVLPVATTVAGLVGKQLE